MLLDSGGEPTVFRTIISVQINAFNGQILTDPVGYGPLKERSAVISPFVADGYASCTVTLVTS